MIRYTSNKQLKLELFESPFERGLDPENRWVKLARALPWDDMASAYYSTMSSNQGAPGKDARIVVGAVIIKHKLQFSDREVIDQIKENPYLQYFLGLERFTNKEVFDASLFPRIRKRLGVDQFETMNNRILNLAGITEAKPEPESEGDEPPEDMDGGPDETASTEITEPQQKEEELKDKPRYGKLLIDAMVTEQMIKYPTDLDLLNDSRLEAERLIDLIYDHEPGQLKPRTYRRNARRDYLAIAKQSRKSRKTIRKAIRKQLGYLKRDLDIIERLLDGHPDRFGRLSFRDLKIYWVIQQIYQQQQFMYQNKVHTHPDRIVSIYQPWVRPMVTGKAFPKVQFGAKVSVSLIKGFASIHRIDWDNFNEGGDLQGQVKAYAKRHGHYPEAVVADQKYGTRENRRWLKELGIRFSGKALGRPKKDPGPEDMALKKLKKKENGMRSQIEGKFGQGKNGYGLRKIRARRADTSASWIAAIFFVMNLVRFLPLTLREFLSHVGARWNQWAMKCNFKTLLRAIFGKRKLNAPVGADFYYFYC